MSAAFHVTMTPMDSVYERCRKNAEEGLRAYLLVPDEHVGSARLLAKERAQGRVAVESIESFVGQNVEEMATFSQDELNVRFRELLETYNERVEAIEVDKSLMIEIPPNLGESGPQARTQRAVRVSRDTARKRSGSDK